MSDAARHAPRPTDWNGEPMQRRIRRRYAAERRFRLLGLAAVLLSAGFLAFLLVTMLGKGITGFVRAEVRLEVAGAPAGADFERLLGEAAQAQYGGGGRQLFSEAAWLSLRGQIEGESGPITAWLPAASPIDQAAKGESSAEAEALYARLAERDAVRTAFNTTFLTGSDATDPAAVGIWGAFKGSLLTMIVTLLLAFPVGVLAAVYLEEYAPRNRWTDAIEVSINNLAAVPSIIFGLLGLAVFLNFMHLPRSAPLVGGITLALMTMPVIVIAGRNAVKAVPPSIRDAALGVGASKVQVVFHHVLPLALPGILTGTIIGMARALGETAPLLMIGMRAFVATPPGGIADPATVLPVQIFLWSDEVSRGFVEKTSAAIIVLLVFLLAMNGVAIYLRNRFEKRW
ncbi:MAG: phosphate ABC transporter permease PstA [Pseudomonadota bacterium]|nr:phosphate ABC transporter permease PstA [Pseudomonadota bacterium]